MADYTTYMYILYIFMVYTLLGYTTGLDITVCKNDGNFPSVNLNCSNNDTIHVASIMYFYNQGRDCGSYTVPCGRPLTSSDTGLISSCTGQSSPCQQFIFNYRNCTGSTVNYRCIPRENGQDICESNLTLKDVTTKFLFSPNYPTASSAFEPHETNCECVIRGTNITSITILDLVLRTGSDGTRSNLFIQYGDITYNKTSRQISQSPLQVYNHRLQSPTVTADIIFTHKQINGQRLWIEIQGLSLAGFCNNILATTTTPLTSPPQPDNTTTPGTSPSSTRTPTHTSTDTSTSSETSSAHTTTINNTDFSTTIHPRTSSEPPTVHSTTVSNTDSSTTIHPRTSSDRSTDTSERSQPATNPSDNEAQQTDSDKDIIIIVLATILPLSVALVIVLFLMHRKGKLKCLNQPSNPGTENSRTITPPEPGTTYSNLSNADRNNTDSAYQELQTRNSNSPYNNLPYSGTDIESGTNYSSLSDSNRLDTDNNNYQQLQTRTPTSPYNNLPYTSEHHTYSN